MEIREIIDGSEKQKITRTVLESMTDWFGIPEAREEYIRESVDKPFFAAFADQKPVGFVCLKETGKNTAELFVMGVLKEHHRQGLLINSQERYDHYLHSGFPVILRDDSRSIEETLTLVEEVFCLTVKPSRHSW